MIQKSTIAVALAAAALGALPATAADFQFPGEAAPYYDAPQYGAPQYEAPPYGAPPQVVYPPPPVHYVPVPPPVYAPRAVVVAPESYVYDEPYYVPRPPAYVYGVQPRHDWRARRPYVERRYTTYRDWGPGYRRW